MKKLSIICCFVLITVFSTGSYLIHECYLNTYKKEFRSYVFQNPQQKLTSDILINPSELYTNSLQVTWEDGNKEVVYKGVLYDIVRVESRGLKVALIAVSDQQEVELKKNFADMFDVNSGKTTKDPFQLLKNFFTLKCIVSEAGLDLAIHNSFYSLLFPKASLVIVPVCLSPETPPPDFV